MTHTYLTLSPAYNRDYKSREQVEKDWNDNKDFVIRTPNIRGRYINKSDAIWNGVKEVSIMYDSYTKNHIIKVEEDQHAEE